MWKNTWGIKEGIMTCAGLLVIGLILHLMTGGVDWNSFPGIEFVCGSGLPGGAGGIVFFAEKALFRALGHVVQSGDSFAGSCVGPYILYGYD